MISPQLIETAITLIEQYGSTITLKTETTAYNTTTGQIESTPNTSNPIKAVIDAYDSKEVQGLIQAGDIKMTLANDNLTINTDAKIVFNALEYNIINIQPVYLEDNIVIYEIQVRR